MIKVFIRIVSMLTAGKENWKNSYSQTYSSNHNLEVDFPNVVMYISPVEQESN